MSDLHLYTASTMNGWKPLIFLEEAQLDYVLTHVSFARREQKQPDYLALNPNGRIPTLVDRANGDFVVMESGAILWYLAEKYDCFLSHDPRERSETLQWLMFQMSAVGPMMGQAMYFQRIAAPRGQEEPFAINRYVQESRRLLEVLNTRLTGRDFLVGEAYSVADMATYPWVKSAYWARVSLADLPALQAWLARLDERPRTQKALTLPEPYPAFFGEGDVAAREAENAARFQEDV